MTDRPDAGRAGSANVLVIGIGNPDRGDDGVGPMVARALEDRLSPGITVLERNSDGLGLIGDWAGHDTVICIDAAAPMGEPGSIHRIDLSVSELPPDVAFTSSHAFGLAEAIALARTLGSMPQAMIVYAIEAAQFDHGAPLSAEVAAAARQVAEDVAREAESLRTAAAPARSEGPA